MRYEITKKEYEEIEDLVFHALNAPNKQEAKRYIMILNNTGYDLAGSAKNILSELCASVDNASGRVADKARKESFCKMDLFKLEGYIKKENPL